jgi:hypothetical protein
MLVVVVVMVVVVLLLLHWLCLLLVLARVRGCRQERRCGNNSRYRLSVASTVCATAGHDRC